MAKEEQAPAALVKPPGKVNAAGHFEGEDFVAKRKDFAKAPVLTSRKPEGETKTWVIAHGTHQHAIWTKGADGQFVVTGKVILHAGDEVKLTEAERLRMDPHGHKFVTAKRYAQLQSVAEFQAEERAKKLALIKANDPTAEPLPGPADDLMGKLTEADEAPEMPKK